MPTQIYKVDGVRVPSVTTITGVMDKGRGLLRWANAQGLKGVDIEQNSGKTFESTVGDLTHAYVEAWAKTRIEGQVVEADDMKYPDDIIELAKKCFAKFELWAAEHHFKPVASELAAVSKEHMYGGCLDIIGEVDGVMTLVDVKTCKELYGEQFTQLAGYDVLCKQNPVLIEAGIKVEQVGIIRVGRNPDEGFEWATINDEIRELNKERFFTCRQLYKLNRKIEKASQAE